MSCACLNRKLGQELERIRRLAKGLARLEGKTVVIIRNADGTYSFEVLDEESDKTIVEYITPY